VLRFGSMADVAMESKGKAAGVKEAAAHLVFECCVMCSVCVQCFLPVNFLGLYPVGFFLGEAR
jgi:hypothetical protein